jgi:hypothetical protein
VLVPSERQRQDTGFARLYRTARIPSRTASIGPVRLALVPRAVADTARQLTLIKQALERGLNRPPLPIRTIPCPTSGQAIQ